MTKMPTDDQWMTNHSPLTVEKHHALGVVTYYWNIAELLMQTVLATLQSKQLPDFWPTVRRMKGGEMERMAIETSTHLPENIKQHLVHMIALFNANRLNRNQLTHFYPAAIESSESLSRLEGAKFKPQPIADSLEDIRRVADEIIVLTFYMGQLVIPFADWKNATTNELVARMYASTERPEVPELLWDASRGT